MAIETFRSPRFRALEYFCLLYDVAVDQEDYNGPWCSIGGCSSRELTVRDFVDVVPRPTTDDSLRPWERDRFRVDPALGLPEALSGLRVWLGEPPGETEALLLESVVLQPLGQNPRIEECGEDTVVDQFWTKLLVAKVSRALLQQESSSSAARALDQVGLALVRQAPVPDCRDETRLGQQLRVLRWLFLNEASACYQGHHSIALAEDCLSHIKDEAEGEGMSPHELVALYNKAQGSLHARNHVDALRRFREVFTSLDSKTSSDHYFDTLSKNPFAWPDCHRLFDAYLRIPSVLQAADTLLNLQRSTDAENELSSLAGLRVTEYQQARIDVMRARIANDLNGSGLADARFDWRQSSCASKRGIALQSLGVEAERHGILAGVFARAAQPERSTTEGESCPA